MSRQPRFAVVGHPNKGKSSIVATLAADDSVRIGPEAGTTTQARRYPMRVDGQELYALVDTPGFQRARRVLHWLRQHECGAHRRAEVVRQFVAAHRDTGEFPDECELLEPILEGAGILYVVDGSVPYGPEYEPEMEILRWTGQPSLALVNPIGPADHVAEWQAALGQFFQVVRGFNAVTAEFRKRIELLRAFGELQEEWRGVLEQAVRLLEADRARTRRLAAHTVAEALAAMLAHRVERKLPARANPAGIKAELEAEFRSDLRRFEQRCRDRVEALYSHRRIERQEAGLPLVDEDLFAERTWLVFGLGRRQILAGGALGGAATGAWVDAHLGGASLFAGAVLGAGIGAVVGWWTADRLVKVRVMDLPLGGRWITAGPTRNRNFPHVVFNRARYHHWLVARRTHAAQGVLAVSEDPRQLLPPLPGEELSALEKVFGRLRRNPEATGGREALAEQVAAVFARDDEAGVTGGGG
jgi:GTPase Era involved in 16S rRNA processing